MTVRSPILLVLFLVGPLVSGLVIVPGGAPAHAAEPEGRWTLIEQGKKVFISQGCYGCHMVGTAGTPIGPDLSRVGFKHSESYLGRWLRDPAAMKPTAHMPTITLSETEVRSLAAYLSTLQ